MLPFLCGRGATSFSALLKVYGDATFVPNNYLGSNGHSVGMTNNEVDVSAGFTSNYMVLLSVSLGDVFSFAVDFTAGSIVR